VFVIVTDVLFSCAGYSVVVLNYTDNIKHCVSCFNHLLNLIIPNILINTVQSVQLIRCMQRVRSVTNVFFIISTRSEISSPIASIVISVREQVIIIGGPCYFFSSDSVDVHLGSGVDELDVRFIHVVVIPVGNHVVDGAEVFMGVLVSKVFTHHNKKVLLTLVVFSLMSDPVIDFLRSFRRIKCF